MSIDLNLTTPLQNASIQYTYPEMDIRSIVKGNTISFKFRNGLSSSSFSFTDTDNSIFKSGVASEGTISTSVHNIGSYELTVKHITSTQNDFFYVVFPIESGDKTSFINSIANSSSTEINIINMSDADNKSLNSMIVNSGSVYKYTNSDEKLVFVFNTPITTSLINMGDAVTSGHSLWNLTTQPVLINLISQGDNEKVSEEIVCEYSGDSIEEPSINNKTLSTTFSKIGSISIFFAVFALYTAFFYTIWDPELYRKEVSHYLLILILIAFIILFIPIYAFSDTNSYKNINFFNINFAKPASFYSLLFIPLWDILYKLVALFIYSSIYSIPDPIYNFIFSFFKTDNLEIKGYNQFLLGLLLVIWVLFVCVILVK